MYHNKNKDMSKPQPFWNNKEYKAGAAFLLLPPGAPAQRRSGAAIFKRHNKNNC
jgi:hypothetical protein